MVGAASYGGNWSSIGTGGLFYEVNKVDVLRYSWYDVDDDSPC